MGLYLINFMELNNNMSQFPTRHQNHSLRCKVWTISKKQPSFRMDNSWEFRRKK